MPQTLHDLHSRAQRITSAARDETPGEDIGNSHGTFGSSFSPLDLEEISSSAALTGCQDATNATFICGGNTEETTREDVDLLGVSHLCSLSGSRDT